MWQHARERATCGGCGTRREEWIGPDGPRLDAYTAEAQICHGCRAISAEQDRVGENAPAGIKFVLKPVPRGGVDGQ